MTLHNQKPGASVNNQIIRVKWKFNRQNGNCWWNFDVVLPCVVLSRFRKQYFILSFAIIVVFFNFKRPKVLFALFHFSFEPLRTHHCHCNLLVAFAAWLITIFEPCFILIKFILINSNNNLFAYSYIKVVLHAVTKTYQNKTCKKSEVLVDGCTGKAQCYEWNNVF